eukprot:TRINITY_DN4598_c0_g1_i1.p1 TRINITY_DN4598_c0_g1~~TRINITY_DN4598_c0_g1_i1.p1  ORF type:complete len:709 (+),score=146.84 TRINITY_DN4598_c0_g1_i1:35-2161(+)
MISTMILLVLLAVVASAVDLCFDGYETSACTDAPILQGITHNISLPSPGEGCNAGAYGNLRTCDQTKACEAVASKIPAGCNKDSCMSDSCILYRYCLGCSERDFGTYGVDSNTTSRFNHESDKITTLKKAISRCSHFGMAGNGWGAPSQGTLAELPSHPAHCLYPSKVHLQLGNKYLVDAIFIINSNGTGSWVRHTNGMPLNMSMWESHWSEGTNFSFPNGTHLSLSVVENKDYVNPHCENGTKAPLNDGSEGSEDFKTGSGDSAMPSASSAADSSDESSLSTAVGSSDGSAAHIDSKDGSVSSAASIGGSDDSTLPPAMDSSDGSSSSTGQISMASSESNDGSVSSAATGSSDGSTSSAASIDGSNDSTLPPAMDSSDGSSSSTGQISMASSESSDGSVSATTGSAGSASAGHSDGSVSSAGHTDSDSSSDSSHADGSSDSSFNSDSSGSASDSSSHTDSSDIPHQGEGTVEKRRLVSTLGDTPQPPSPTSAPTQAPAKYVFMLTAITNLKENPSNALCDVEKAVGETPAPTFAPSDCHLEKEEKGILFKRCDTPDCNSEFADLDSATEHCCSLGSVCKAVLYSDAFTIGVGDRINISLGEGTTYPRSEFIEPTTYPGMSLFFIIALTVVVVVTFYCAIGMVLRVQQGETSCPEVLPNHAFWTTLPANIAQCCAVLCNRVAESSGYSAVNQFDDEMEGHGNDPIEVT